MCLSSIFHGLQIISLGMMYALSVCSSSRVQSIAHFNLASEDNSYMIFDVDAFGNENCDVPAMSKENSSGFYHNHFLL